MSPGRTIQLDETARRLSMTGVRLVVSRGPDRGRALRLIREEATVGTAATCDLTLTDPTVSRGHFTLRVVADGYLVDDHESTNGTWIEGRRVRSAYARPGDRIDIGATRVRLEALRDEVSLPISEAPAFGKLLGRSVAARRWFALLAEVAATDMTLLLLGETGVGKDLAAEAVHDASSRARGPFVVVDCGAVASGLVESELFGHEQGAFTGAHARRIGAFEQSSGGTLFLDEIGELPLELQKKLLRALDRRQVRRIGGADTIDVDVRIVAATNRDLRSEVNRGAFRADLLYRLNTVTIRVPSLRDRVDDIPMLAEHFRREVTNDPDGHFADGVLEAFALQPWPGNVRELRNAVERALTVGHTPVALGGEQDHLSFRKAKADAVDGFERTYLTALLQRAGGNRSEAARLAQMDRAHLIKLLRRHGID